MRYVLFTARGPQQGRIVPIRPRVFRIGSSCSSQLRCAPDGIGKRHCVLVIRKKKLYVQDRDSGFPTLLNGHTIPAGEREKLRPGDHLQIGPLEFVVKMQRKRRRAHLSLPHKPPPADSDWRQRTGLATTKRQLGHRASPAVELRPEPTPVCDEPAPSFRRHPTALLTTLLALVLVGGTIVGYVLNRENARDEDGAADRNGNEVPPLPEPTSRPELPQPVKQRPAVGQQQDWGPPTPFPASPEPKVPTQPP